MDIERQIAYWRRGAEEEIEVADELLNTRRYRHALFLAHLALEKMIKAHVTRVIQDVPPRIHNLVRLSEIAALNLTQNRIDFLHGMNGYQLWGRYPEEEVHEISAETAHSDMLAAKEMMQWLRTQF